MNPSFLDAARWRQNSAFMLVNQCLGLIISILMTPLIARHLGPSSYGLMNWVIAYLALFQGLVPLGSGQIGIREVAKNPSQASHVISQLFLLNMVGGLLAYSFAAIMALGGSYPRDQANLILIWGLYLLVLPLGNWGIILQASLESRRLLWASLASNVVLIALYTLALARSGDVQAFLVAGLAGQVVLQFATISQCRRWFTLPTRWDRSMLRHLFLESLPLNIMALLISVMNRLDVMLLDHFRGSYEVGLYSAAGRLVQVCTFVPQAVAASLLPIFSQGQAGADKSSIQAQRESQQMLVVLGLFVPILAWFRGEDIIRLIFGRKYLGSSLAFQLLCLTIPLICVGILPSNLLTARGRQWQNLKFVVVGAAVSVIANLLSIPHWGMKGAALSAALAYAVLVFMQVWASLQLWAMPFGIVGDLRKAAPALALLGGFLWLARAWPLIPVVALSCGIYLAALRARGVPLWLRTSVPSPLGG